MAVTFLLTAAHVVRAAALDDLPVAAMLSSAFRAMLFCFGVALLLPLLVRFTCSPLRDGFGFNGEDGTSRGRSPGWNVRDLVVLATAHRR